MNRRGFLTLCAAMGAIDTCAAAPPPDPFEESVRRMHEAWDRFVRKYWGCPADAHATEDCKPALGSIDRKAFGQARTAAKKLFQFSD